MTSFADPSQRAALRPPSQQSMRETLSHPLIVALFLASATQPYGIQLGPLLVGPYRLILMIVGPMLFLKWLSGAYGRIVLPDLLMLFHTIWNFVALAANGQMNRVVEWGGAQFIDIFFGYLLGRAAIRNREDFYYFTKILLIVLLFLLPFAILESTAGRIILITMADKFPLLDAFHSATLFHPPRLGLFRAQTSAAHPILYGVLCAMAFSFALLGLSHSRGKPSLAKRIIYSVGSYAGTFFSLSSGAFLAVMIQAIMMAWNWIAGAWNRRWHAVAAGAAASYVAIAIVSERPPLLALAKIAAFSPSTAWNRYLIWNFGSAEVGRNPIFGMGIFYEWQRAPWMPASVDNHWLLIAMRFGLPGIVSLLGAFFYVLYRLIRIDFSHDREMAAIRDSLVFTFTSLIIAFATVAAWHVQYSILLMLLGGCVWIFDDPAVAGTPKEEAPAKGRRRSGPRRGAAAEAGEAEAGGAEADGAQMDPADGIAAPEPDPKRTRYTRFADRDGARTTRRR